MLTVSTPQVVLEQGDDLSANETHLRGKLHRGFAKVRHCVDEFWVEHHDRLGSHRADLGGTERDDVDADVGGELLEAHAEGGGSVRQTSAIEVQQQVVLVGIVGERLDFGRGVKRAELGGVGDRNHTRLRAVNAADVEHRGLNDFWGELAVWGW